MKRDAKDSKDVSREVIVIDDNESDGDDTADTTSSDYLLALKLQMEEILDPEPVRSPASYDVLDPSLELLDPTPDIRALFLRYNSEFFHEALCSTVIEWSRRMTTCAGICYCKREGFCIIRLSQPLLQFRPRSDLVNTLLVCFRSCLYASPARHSTR